jgi:hypothetical protein
MPTGQADAFLQPESMVTPGALGALVMLITNALVNNFPAVSGHMFAIVLSFAFGLVAVVKCDSIIQKGIYYALNSLIVFSVATGTNSVGLNVQSSPVPAKVAAYFAVPVADAAPFRQPGLPGHGGVTRIQFFKSWSGQPVAAPAAIPPGLADSGWSVVVGSFQDQAQADTMKQAITAKFQGKYTGDVSKSLSNGLFAVTVGGRDLSLADAAVIQRQVVADGLASDAYLKRSALLAPGS